MAGALAFGPLVLGVFLLAHQLTLHEVIAGVTFQGDGTNLGSALALTGGQLPYDNFALAQPPGMTIIMLPFAGIAHAFSSAVGLSAARVVTAIVAAADVFLVAFLARYHGLASTAAAGILFALYPFAFLATGSALFAPWLLFCCLLAAVLAFEETELSSSGGHLLAAGLLLGYAVVIKPWAIVPALVLVGCCLVKRREYSGHLIGGIVAAIVIPCFIFFLAAPGNFWRDVVVAELGQNGARAGAVGSRFAQVLGLGAPIGLHSAGALATALAAIVLAVILLVMLAQRHLVSVMDIFFLVSSVALVLVALVPDQLPSDYGYFAAGFFMVLVGNLVGNVMEILSSLPGGQTDVGATLGGGISLVVVAGAIALIAVGSPKETSYERGWFLRHGTNPSALVDAHVPRPACVLSNDASVLVVSNRAIGHPSGCPSLLDPDGLIAASGLQAGATTSPALVTEWEQYLGASSYVVISDSGGAIPWDPALRSYFDGNFTRVAQNRTLAIFANKGNAIP